jgi:hypothetical protein
MNTPFRSVPVPHAFETPSDLCHWVSPDELFKITRQTLDDLCWTTLSTGYGGALSGSAKYRLLLAIVLFYLSRGCRSAREIRDRLLAHSFITEHWPELSSHPEKLRIVLTQNPVLIRQCLAHVLESVWIGRFGQQLLPESRAPLSKMEAERRLNRVLKSGCDVAS